MSPKSPKFALFNSVAFTAAWWGVVKSAEWRSPWLLWLVVIGYFVVHGRYFASKAILLSTLLVATVGYFLDMGLQALGVFFVRDSVLELWPPLWLFLMWVLFVSSLPASMHNLRGKWLMSALVGGLGGYLSYWAGTQVGILTFGIPHFELGLWERWGNIFGLKLQSTDLLSKAFLFVYWIVVFPVFLELQSRIQALLEVKYGK